jgi:hypothetical protein
MKRPSKIIIASAVTLLGVFLWFFTREQIVVTEGSPLWASEYDAYRQGSSYPGSGIPKAQLRSGDRLKVIWTAEGKDYIAVFVIRSNFEHGWLLLWQTGIAPARS